MGSFFLGLLMYGSGTLGSKEYGIWGVPWKFDVQSPGVPWPSPLNHGSGYWHIVYAHSGDRGHEGGFGDSSGGSGGDG